MTLLRPVSVPATSFAAMGEDGIELVAVKGQRRICVTVGGEWG